MVDYAGRLDKAMKHAGLSVTALSGALGLSYQAVKKVIDGKSKSFSAENNSKAAKALGVSSDWLASGKGSMLQERGAGNKVSDVQAQEKTHANVEDAPTLRRPRRVPVVGEIKGGAEGYFEELQYPVGHGEGFVEYWTSDPHAYALRVKGDSMHPRYRAGEFVVITPSIEPTPHNDVAVYLHDGQKLLKQLNWIKEAEIQLLSINNGYGPMTIDRADVLKIHRVGGSVPSDAFMQNQKE